MTTLRKCTISIIPTPEVAGYMKAQTLDYGDEEARRRADEIAEEFNAKVLGTIVTFAHKIGMNAHADFTKAVIRPKTISFPATSDLHEALTKKRLRHTGACDLT